MGDLPHMLSLQSSKEKRKQPPFSEKYLGENSQLYRVVHDKIYYLYTYI